MEEKTTTPFHDSASDDRKESQVNAEKVNSAESEEVQGELQVAADETGASEPGEGSGGGATVQENINKKKKGKARPETTDGVSNIGSLEPLPPATASSQPSSRPSSSSKRARGRPKGTGKLQTLASHGEYMDTAGASFTPHVLSVFPGEDIVSKIGSFCETGPRSVCVLTASGAVSSVTLRKPGTPDGSVTYEGWFEILTLAGSSVVSGELRTHSRNGLLSVSLANSDGQVFGGTVAGPLVAASPGPIQLVVGSFKQNISRGIKRKYSAGRSTSVNDSASSKMVNLPIQVTGMADDDENCDPAPVPVRARPMESDKVVAENDILNSASLERVDPNNSQKDDPVKAGTVIAENEDFNSTSPQSVSPGYLQTSPASQPKSDEMMTPDTDADVPEMQ
ncbi:AT-hook motif nuclear-localized protein 11-like [Herrania umbratica]|uniref:AT-hook motif nuclear-localized protein n=1 Tax=Herrania umbratica TaxID=108875 RepID=A0A6J0ZXJ8_9ROSI|nr:AT-hook motif nuclear-localized protein 11-like [Herrania umbratica]